MKSPPNNAAARIAVSQTSKSEAAQYWRNLAANSPLVGLIRGINFNPTIEQPRARAAIGELLTLVHDGEYKSKPRVRANNAQGTLVGFITDAVVVNRAIRENGGGINSVLALMTSGVFHIVLGPKCVVDAEQNHSHFFLAVPSA
jgi:hypothetical protein